MRARDRASLRGFTLLELLVVLVIIGVMVAMVTLSTNVLGQDSQVEEETRRFWAVLRQAREEAELQSIDLAVFVGSSEYEFLRFDTRRNEWRQVADDSLYAPRTLPEGLRFRIWLEGRELVLKPGLPDRSKKDENQKWPPQLTVLSSGDVVPFELQLERDNTPALWRMTSQVDGDLRVEQRRKDQDEWRLVVQTKPPPEDQKGKERLSNARW
ncbi:MAG TPA: type II secretion system minor pseudopilin GspH [Steroidobacteraceae bacterium]|nr:type II secretion system minor pseudopilin GspH [Steroidobacteraceae bacterium]